MHPILFVAGGVTIWSHPVFASIGVAVALWMTVRVSRAAGRLDRRLLYLVAGGLLFAAVFARFGLVFRYLQAADEPTLAGFLRFGGRSLLGGLVGGYLGIVLTKRVIGYSRSTGDLFVPGVAVGMAIGRVGCFLAERPGTITSLPWAVRVPSDAVPLVAECPACAAGAPMHPSFLYELVFDLLLAWAIVVWRKSGRLPARWMQEGDVFKAFLLVYAGFRFFVEFVRGNPAMWLGMSGSQLMALASAAGLVLYLARRRLQFNVAASPA